VFGPDRPSFVDAMIKRAQQEEKIDAIADKFSTPTYTHDIANMLPQFFDRGVAGGILHFANAGKCSWQEYAQWALDCCYDAGIPLNGKTVGALKMSEMTNWLARRPVYSVLSTAKYAELTGTTSRAWREAVADYITRFYSKK
jgi:dTDP-4-dehydrorhamnose reductase